MNLFYPNTRNEACTYLSLVEDLNNNVEKQILSVPLNLYNVKFKDLKDNNMKYQVHFNTRSKLLPKLSPNNFRLQKHINSIGYEDLTEVTLTEAITEPSDSPKSKPAKNIFKNFGICSKMKFLNNKNLMLLAPDESYHNAKKFNHQINEIKYSYSNGQNRGLIKFPLLQINDSDFQKKQLYPSIISKQYLNNNRNKFGFLVTSENFKDKENHLLIDSVVENRNEKNNITNKQNSTNFSIDNTTANNLINQSDTQIVTFENMDNFNDINSPRDVSIDLTVNSSDPNIVLHNGYIITTDSITPQRDSDIITIETNDFSKIKRIKGAVKRDRDRDNKASIRIAENKTEIFHKNKEKIQYESEIEGFNMNEKINKKVSINFEYPPIQDIPILSPDILGKINIRNHEKVKHFLGVKSIDENGWNEMISINLDNARPKSSSLNKLALVDSEQVNIDKDSYTNKILGLNKNQKNLSQTIQNMNEKISEMEKISLLLDKEFSNSKKVHLNTDEMNVEIYTKQENMNDKLEKSLNLITNCEEKSSSRIDISLLSELSEYSSASGVLNISERSSTNSVPQIELFSSDNVFNKSNKESKVKYLKPISSRILKPSVKIKNNKFHNEMEKNNYLQRKCHGKYLAMEMLNQLGLPHTKSSDMPVTIITNPSPNEMMLSEIRRNEQLNLFNSISNFKCVTSLQSRKKKIPKPFQESVRLQRPEITRRQNTNKPFTYTESLLALKPKKRALRNHKISENNVKHFQPTAELSISQDTDIISVSSDWSVPQKIHEILYNKSQNNSDYNVDDVSQIISIQSTSFIDWDQVSDMLKSLSVN